MPLIDDEKSQQEYSVLVEHSNQLQRKIFKVKYKRQRLNHKMQLLTNSINILEEEKAKKSWKITLLNIVTFGIFKYQKTKGINQQIKKLQIKTEKLQKKITKNEKVKYTLKNKKLKVREKLVNFFKNLLTNKEVASNHHHEQAKQEVDLILENQNHIKVAATSCTPPVADDRDEQLLVPSTKLSSRQNSEDSGFEGEQINTDEEDGIGVMSEPDADVINPRIFLRRDNRESILSFERKLASIIEEEGIGVMSEPDEDAVSYLLQVSSIWNNKDSGFDGEQVNTDEEDGIEVVPEPDADEASGMFSRYWDSKDSGFEFERGQASTDEEDGIEVISDPNEDDDIEVIPDPNEDDDIEVISESDEDEIDLSLKLSSKWDSKEGSSLYEVLEKLSIVVLKNTKSVMFSNLCNLQK